MQKDFKRGNDDDDQPEAELKQTCDDRVGKDFDCSDTEQRNNIPFVCFQYLVLWQGEKY